MGVTGLLLEDRITEGCLPVAANCLEAGGAEALRLRRLDTGLSREVKHFTLELCRESIAGLGGTAGRGDPGE